MIHESAVVAPDADLGQGLEIGPFAVIGHDGGGARTVLGPDGMIRSHAVIYRDVRIGSGFHAGHGALIRQGCRIGVDVSIGSHSVLEHDVTVGDGVRLHSRCFIPELTVLEAGAWIGPGVVVTNARYPARHTTKAQLEGVTVGVDAVVGGGAVLLPGVVVGRNATVGAGAVVTLDVAAGQTVVGNPARSVS